MKYLKLVIAFSSIVLLAACNGKGPAAPTSSDAPSVTASSATPGGNYAALHDHHEEDGDRESDDGSELRARLSADPTQISAGGSSKLAWDTHDAKSVTLNGSSVSSDGEKRVWPSSTTEYVLVATNGSHSVTSRVTVTVLNGTPPPVPTASLTASSISITAGQSSTLSWTTTNATSATLNGSAVSTSGSQSVTPASTTTYTLNATNAAGSSTSSVVVTVTAVAPPPPPPPAPAPTATLSASAASIVSGGSVTLTWTTTNATSATLNGGAVAVNGSQAFSPTVNTTYTLMATGAGGSVNKSVSVTVTAPPPAFTYTADIKPYLDVHCVVCHNATLASSGVNLSSYAALQPVVASHDSSAKLVTATQPGGVMYNMGVVGPSATMTSAQVIDMIKQWVLSGAPQ